MSHSWSTFRTFCSLASIMILLTLIADVPLSADQQKQAAPQPATHRVTRAPFKVEVTLSGTIEAATMKEVSLKPKAWADLKVKEAVKHGTRVREKGDVLVALETDKLEEAIEGLELDNRLSELTIEQSELDLEVLEKQLTMDLAAAEKSQRHAREDLERYLKIDGPLSAKSAEQSIISARNYLEYQKEELDQLEKMYKADDLTEETEEIILRRQRDTVNRAIFSLERTEKVSQKSLELEIPRQREALKTAARAQLMAYEKTRQSLPRMFETKKIALEKLRIEHEKMESKIEKMHEDLDTMKVRSPAEGIVYYGRCVRGQWSSMSTVVPMLRGGGTARANEVLMTVVDPTDLLIRLNLPEKELHHLKRGQKGTAMPTGYPDRSIAVKISEVSLVPILPGTFDMRVSMGDSEDLDGMVPGMTCSVRFTPYFKKKAIAIPSAAIHSDGGVNDAYVYIKTEDGGHRKQDVQVGRKAGNRTEIVRGLEEGDEVLVNKPK